MTRPADRPPAVPPAVPSAAPSVAPPARPPAVSSRPGRRRFWYRAQREWLALLLLLAALAIWNGPLGNGLPALAELDTGQPDPTGQVESQGPLARLDLALYDLFLRTSALPRDPQITIVAIDDDSVAQIGRWPWRRPIIAELVTRVAALSPGAMAIDIVFAEPAADPMDDVFLAGAFDYARPALAVAREPFGATGFLPLYPVAALAREARLGHVVMTHGADGRVRGLFAREGHLPALSLTLVDPAVRYDARAADQMLARGLWTSEQPLMPRAHRQSPEAVSALAVLRGTAPRELIEGRLVLIGTTAVGVGDTFSTPLIIDRNRASGVELHAVAASALSHGTVIRPINPWSHAALTLAAIIGLMVLLFRAAPEYSLPICVAAIVLVLVVTATAFRFDRWIQPAGLLTALVLAYPLWSWRRLSAAAAGLLRHARRLESVPSVLAPSAHAPRSAEPIARELGRLSDAATQVRLLNRFLLDGLESLPHPVLIAEPNGRILFRNRRMIEAFGEAVPAVGGLADQWFETTFNAPLPAPQAPIGSLDREDSGLRRSIELLDKQRRSWLVSLNLTNRADGRPALAAVPDDESDPGDPVQPDSGERLMLQLVDISALRAAEREREEAISFLSHDLRSPQVSILAMASARDGASPIDPASLRRHAQRALEMTDEFLAFARAGTKPIEREPYDLADLATEVVDLSWDRASKAGVRLAQAGDIESAMITCDPGMIRRAVLNLIENAIRHTVPDSTVTVRLSDLADEWGLEIEDQGPGIEPSFLASIFQAWSQADRPAGAGGESRGSSGLGLAMVQRTVSRHGGSVNARNRTESQGAVFEIRLPKAPAGIIFDHGTADDRTQSRDGPAGHP